MVNCLQEFLASGDYDDVEDLEEKLGKFKGQSICVTCKNVCHLSLNLIALLFDQRSIVGSFRIEH